MVLSNLAPLWISRFVSTCTQNATPGAKDITGSSVTCNYEQNNYPWWKTNMYGTDADGKMRIVVGTGDTEPTVNDYHLENDVTASLTLVNGTFGNRASRGDFPSTIATFKNDTVNAITIKEVGLEFTFRYSSSYHAMVLVSRKVITPITINPGETYTFTHYISVED